MEDFTLTLRNELNKVHSLGSRFPRKLRVGNDLSMGQFTWETTDLDLFQTYGSTAITIASYPLAADGTPDYDTYMKVSIPNAKIMDYTHELRGDSQVDVQVPFHAYPSGEDSKEEPIFIAVAGTFNMFGMDTLYNHFGSLA